MALPDTQYYSQDYPDIFACQTRWVRYFRDDHNVAFLVHEGDIVEHSDSKEEWARADSSLGVLDGEVPYSLAPGNHDYDVPAERTGPSRTYEWSNRYFPPSHFDAESWYGGHMGEGNQNSYAFFNAAGMDFMVISLEWAPSDGVLAWANGVVSAHSGRRVIVVTHGYMYDDNTRTGEGDKFAPGSGNDGEGIWEKFVRRHPNIFLVLSGHIIAGDGVGRLTSIGDAGNPVHQLLADYQLYRQGGSGWLRLIKFAPSEDRMYVPTYSPMLDIYVTGPENRFELEYEMRAPASGVDAAH